VACVVSFGQILIPQLTHRCIQFIFSQVPNEYPFGVEDHLRGEAQIIDISDETTGLPHIEAQEHLNMYVRFYSLGFSRPRKNRLCLVLSLFTVHIGM
jgi:hypothetical protein